MNLEWKGRLFIAILMFANVIAKAQLGNQIKEILEGVTDKQMNHIKGIKRCGWHTCILAYYFADKQYVKTAEIDVNGSFFFFWRSETLKGGIIWLFFLKENM